MKTKEEIKALEDKLAAGRAARKERLDARADEVKVRRLENEVLLIELEQKTGYTLGLDMGVVWLTSGDMVVVHKPQLLPYERYVTRLVDAPASDRSMLADELLKSEGCVVHPDLSKLESLNDEHGDAKLAAANLAARMHDVQSVDYRGKS